MSDCWCCGAPSGPSAHLAPLPFDECPRCGFAFREDAGDVAEVYASGAYEEVRGEEYLRLLDGRRHDARVRVGLLAPYATSGRLLDVGAAGGAFVAEAGAAGFTAAGVEPTPAFAELARTRLGVDVTTGTLGELAPAPGALDVCTYWHVLEHIPHPAEELARVREALRPGGVLAIEVPNAGGILAARQGTAWPSLEPEVHVGQFTPAALRTLLERAGFTPRRVWTVTSSPYLRGAARLAPRQLVHRLRTSAWLRSGRVEHPTGHEVLRAVAVRP